VKDESGRVEDQIPEFQDHPGRLGSGIYWAGKANERHKQNYQEKQFDVQIPQDAEYHLGLRRNTELQAKPRGLVWSSISSAPCPPTPDPCLQNKSDALSPVDHLHSGLKLLGSLNAFGTRGRRSAFLPAPTGA
jgi:hypothetical protein